MHLSSIDATVLWMGTFKRNANDIINATQSALRFGDYSGEAALAVTSSIVTGATLALQAANEHRSSPVSWGAPAANAVVIASTTAAVVAGLSFGLKLANNTQDFMQKYDDYRHAERMMPKEAFDRVNTMVKAADLEHKGKMLDADSIRAEYGLSARYSKS